MSDLVKNHNVGFLVSWLSKGYCWVFWLKCQILMWHKLICHFRMKTKRFCVPWLLDFHNILKELRPLIDVRISFQLNSLRTNEKKQIKFCTLINIDSMTRSTLRLLATIFCKILRELWPLIDLRILFPFRNMRTN